MEKIKLKSDEEFELIPMGISNDSTSKTRSFRFISPVGYADTLAIVSTESSFESIQIIGADGNPQATYADCVSFKGLAFEKGVKIDDNTTADVYTVTYTVNAVERELLSLKKQLDGTQILSDNAVAELTILMATLYGMLSA